jgi:hypothetical protein
MNTLEERLRRIEDIEAIRRLKYRYAELCDDNYRPQALADLFAPDGVWDGGDEYGRYVGREEIAGYWSSCAETIPFAIHFILNHVVDIQEPGRTATGSCNLLQPMTLDGKPYWAGVRYDERYVVHDNAWRFSSSRLTTLLLAPHKEGW